MYDMKLREGLGLKFASGTHCDMPDLECRRKARDTKAAKHHFGKQVNVNMTISMVSVCGKDLSEPTVNEICHGQFT